MSRRLNDRLADAERGTLDLMRSEFWTVPTDYDWTQAAGVIIRNTARRYIGLILADAQKPQAEWNGLTRAFYDRVDAYLKDPSMKSPGFTREEAERLLRQMKPDE